MDREGGFDVHLKIKTVNMKEVPVAQVAGAAASLPVGLALAFLWMQYLKVLQIEATCPCWNKQAVEQAYAFAVIYTAVVCVLGVLLAIRYVANVRARRAAD